MQEAAGAQAALDSERVRLREAMETERTACATRVHEVRLLTASMRPSQSPRLTCVVTTPLPQVQQLADREASRWVDEMAATRARDASLLSDELAEWVAKSKQLQVIRFVCVCACSVCVQASTAAGGRTYHAIYLYMCARRRRSTSSPRPSRPSSRHATSIVTTTELLQ
jgi:hypothetical protein